MFRSTRLFMSDIAHQQPQPSTRHYAALHIEDSHISRGDMGTPETLTLEIPWYKRILEFVERIRLERPDWHEIAIILPHYDPNGHNQKNHVCELIAYHIESCYFFYLLHLTLGSLLNVYFCDISYGAWATVHWRAKCRSHQRPGVQWLAV